MKPLKKLFWNFMNNIKTFRLFISSTFNDFKIERQILHEKVFPAISEYCQEQQYQFQPIDLRWGISNEAQLDQKTLDLCLNEVRACKYYPHPNFLIMLGDRYGWIPLPYSINADEFEAITQYITKDFDYIKHWYILDENALPAAYILRERRDERKSSIFSEKFRNDYASMNDENQLYNIQWAKEENILRSLLQNAAKLHFKDTTQLQYRKYFFSATEAELEERIFDEAKSVDSSYIYAWMRDISNKEEFTSSSPNAGLYIDSDEDAQAASSNFQDKLKQLLQEENNFQESSVALDPKTDWIVTDEQYLKDFEIFILNKLKNAVDKQIAQTQEVNLLREELLEQKVFKHTKLETFFGRFQELQTLVDYTQDKSSEAFMVHGNSGVGKSAFIAKFIHTMESKTSHKVFYRFIGATSSSSDIRVLLELLVQELAEKKLLTLPAQFQTDTNQFNEQIKQLLLSITEDTIIVFDALDQLQEINFLQWLPLQLPTNLKIIVSMLDQRGYEHYYTLLKYKVSPSKQLQILSLQDSEAKSILKELLSKENRQLTKEQFDYVVEQYIKSDSSILYLKIALQEIKSWKSYTNDEELNTGVKEIIKEFIDNLTSRFHHDKTIVHKVLGLISASRDGLSEKEILELLGRDEEILSSLEQFHDLTLNINGVTLRKFPISIWVRLYEQLKPFFNERLVDGQKLINFFHRQIDEAVSEYCYKHNASTLHQDLSDYFFSLQDTSKTWNNRFYSPHMLSELPYQLQYSGNTKELKSLIYNLEFVGASFHHNKFQSLQESMKKSALEIDTLQKFYSKHAYFLTNLDEPLLLAHQVLFQLTYEENNPQLNEVVNTLLAQNKVDWFWLKKEKLEIKKETGLSFYYQNEIACSCVMNETDSLCLLKNKDFVLIDKEGNITQRFILNCEEEIISIEWMKEHHVILHTDLSMIVNYDLQLSKEIKIESIKNKEVSKLDLLDDVDSIFASVSIEADVNDTSTYTATLLSNSMEGNREKTSFEVTKTDENYKKSTQKFQFSIKQPIDWIKTNYAQFTVKYSIDAQRSKKIKDWLFAMEIVYQTSDIKNYKIFILRNQNILLVTDLDIFLFDGDSQLLDSVRNIAKFSQVLLTKEEELVFLNGTQNNAIEHWKVNEKISKISLKYNKNSLKKLYALNDEYFLCSSKNDDFIYLYNFKTHVFYSGIVLSNSIVSGIDINYEDIRITTDDGLYSYRINKILETKEELKMFTLLYKLSEASRIGNFHHIIKSINRTQETTSNHSKMSAKTMLWSSLVGLPVLGTTTVLFEFLYLSLKNTFRKLSKSSLFMTLYHQIIFSKKALKISETQKVSLHTDEKREGIVSLHCVNETDKSLFYIQNIYHFDIHGIKSHSVKTLYEDEFNKLKSDIYKLYHSNTLSSFDELLLYQGDK